jgi:hypothetical protein
MQQMNEGGFIEGLCRTKVIQEIKKLAGCHL